MNYLIQCYKETKKGIAKYPTCSHYANEPCECPCHLKGDVK